MSQEFSFDTKVLQFLVAIANEGSLSRAADSQYLSQPALSRHLRKAEEELGVSLFIRTHSKMKLTAEGAIFISGARRLLQLSQDMDDRVAACRLNRATSLHLMTEEVCLPLLNAQLAPQFEAQFPAIRLQITTGGTAEITAALTAGTADLGLYLCDGESTPFYEIEQAYPVQLLLCGSLATAQPVQKALLSRRHTSLRRIQEQHLRSQEATGFDIICEANIEPLLQLLQLGCGAAVLPAFALQNSPDIPTQPIPSHTATLTLARHRSSRRTAQLQYCVEQIHTIFEQEGDCQ